jgi:hypothetical protein
LHLREQCGALRVHLAWSRSKKVQVPLEKWHVLNPRLHGLTAKC